MRLLSTCLPTVPHSTEKIKATQGLLGLNDLKMNCSGRFEYYQHLSISLENPENRRDVRRDALLFFMSGNTAFEPIGNIFYQGVTMKVNEFELESLPETLSMEQIRLICHVSKLTARFYVKSGLIKNKNSGKQTRCYREIIGAAEGLKEDAESWKSFLVWLKERGLDGVKLIVGDKCLGMCNAVAEVFPETKYQRCTVHFYRNVFSVTPRKHMREVTRMLKAIHAQESKEAARKKAQDVAEKLRSMRLNEAVKKVEDGIEETLTYMDFPSQHWLKIRTNNVIERMNREIRRRTRVVGTFPDGKSALMLVCARLRYVSGKEWVSKRYLCMKYLTEAATDAFRQSSGS